MAWLVDETGVDRAPPVSESWPHAQSSCAKREGIFDNQPLHLSSLACLTVTGDAAGSGALGSSGLGGFRVSAERARMDRQRPSASSRPQPMANHLAVEG